ncbi:uncharacterized protein EAF02_000673 [Botrytis sinoallii]|uniref:uncharacterized protein n=1 Tax=Botrytis sinoallii TaxID=1463999 RepID=UPI001900DB20|nr:uncharacterized protein EAF02_000673 [Botrytis sinoallii]KAF7893135.1 hypothetical protein EAF02_000673 [Botrytis sinoallii]
MPTHRSYSQWLLAIKNRVIRPNPPDSPLETRDEWNSLVDRLMETLDWPPFVKEIRDYVWVSALWNHYFGLGKIHNAPLFISRPSYCDIDWLMPSIQVLQSDHESQVQPPVLPPQLEEQDHTPENMNAAVAAVIAVDEIYVDWYRTITERALDPRRPLVTEEAFRDNLAVPCLWNDYFGHGGVGDPPNFLTRPQYVPLEWLPLEIQELHRELALIDRTLGEPARLAEHQEQPQHIRGIQQPPLNMEERNDIPGTEALMENNASEVDEQHLRRPRIQCINCGRRNHALYDCPEQCQVCGNNQHFPNCRIQAALNRPRPSPWGLGLDTDRSWSEYFARRFGLNYTSVVEGNSIGAGKGADDDVREA